MSLWPTIDDVCETLLNASAADFGVSAAVQSALPSLVDRDPGDENDFGRRE